MLNCPVNDLNYIFIGQAVEHMNPAAASHKKAKHIKLGSSPT